jgi:glycosyltransferase involved in cell wall biosynthesis
MDKNWKVFIMRGRPINMSGLPCLLEFCTVSYLGSQNSVLSRVLYLLSCVVKGVKLVKDENIPVITQHDGHAEYGIVAYVISRLTHRKCLMRINEDTLIPLLFFLRSSSDPIFKSSTVLKAVAYIYRSVENFLFKHVDWIATHGPMDYERIKKINNKITFVPLWIDTKKFRRTDEDSIRKLREQLTIGKDVKVILFVGRLHPEKGIQTLMEALAMLKVKKFLLLMVYYYAYNYKEKYERLVKRLRLSDKVRFLGYISHNDLPKYYSASDLYVLPSIREQWSNTIMEAMACKTPVIATEVGANPYLIFDGQTGFLVPANDPLSLAQKIGFALNNPDLIARITETAANEIKAYDKDKVGKLYTRVVKRLIIM